MITRQVEKRHETGSTVSLPLREFTIEETSRSLCFAQAFLHSRAHTLH